MKPKGWWKRPRYYIRQMVGFVQYAFVVAKHPNLFHAKLAIIDTYWSDWSTAIEYYNERIGAMEYYKNLERG